MPSTVFNTFIRCATFLSACGLTPAISLAADSKPPHYPTRPIRFIVPLAPGGSVDIAARNIAPDLSAILGQQVVIDNRAGAGGNIGADLAAHAPADGYTWVMGSSSTFGVNPTLYRNLNYNAVRDFAPISLVSLAPNVMVVHPALPTANVKEFVAYAKARPGKVNFASSGTGGSPHLAGELFKLVTGVDIVHIPYKSTGQSLTDLIGGQVQVSFGTVLALLPQIQAGRLRALAVTTSHRVDALPQVPTMGEVGYPAIIITAWNGVLVPAKTPRPIIQYLHASLVQVLQKPEVVRQFNSTGAEVAPNSPEAFGAYIKHEIDRWGKVVRNANLQAQ
jgi:tripartite-type tricarboxylate transporter receptor subunit TctC